MILQILSLMILMVITILDESIIHRISSLARQLNTSDMSMQTKERGEHAFNAIWLCREGESNPHGPKSGGF